MATITTIQSTDAINASRSTINTNFSNLNTDKIEAGSADTLTNKTLTSPVINTAVSGTAILDEDDMATDSDTQLATQQSIKKYVDDSTPTSSKTVSGLVELATTAELDTGTDSTRAVRVDQYVASTRNVRYVNWRIVGATANCEADTTVGGDLEFPFTGTITEIGAYNDTAGTTGTMVVDVNKNGSTIMTTDKLDIDTTEKTTRTAATAPALTDTALTAGDILRADVDTIHTTPAKGLTIRLGVRLT